jgi:vacuolar-type H+-ATPase subunit E/Vma4
MSTKSIKEGLSAIANEVLEDVGKEAENIIQEAEARAKDTLKMAKEEADQTYITIVGEADVKTQAEKRRIESLTDVEARNRLLQTKEALVDEVFERVVAKLQELVKTEGYHEYLPRLIEEAAQKMDSKNLIVHLNAADKAWLTQDKLSQLSEKLRVNLRIAKEPEHCLGGCRIQTPKGDVTYDNTLESRLEQRRPELRMKAAKIMFEEAKENAG